MNRALGYVWGTLFVLAAWWLLAVCVGSPALPGPVQTVHELGANAGALLPQTAISLERLLAGLAFGALIGAPIGLLAGMKPLVDRFVSPVLYILFPVPKIVFLPVLFVFFGLGGQAKVPVGQIEAMRSLGGNGWLVFFHVVVPSTLPYLFSGLRVSTGTAVAILFIGESMAGSTGLGYYIMYSWSMLDYARMFSGIVALTIVGVVLYEVFDLAERKLAAR